MTTKNSQHIPVVKVVFPGSPSCCRLLSECQTKNMPCLRSEIHMCMSLVTPACTPVHVPSHTCIHTCACPWSHLHTHLFVSLVTPAFLICLWIEWGTLRNWFLEPDFGSRKKTPCYSDCWVQLTKTLFWISVSQRTSNKKAMHKYN